MYKSIATNEDYRQLFARTPDKYYDLAIVDPEYGINAPAMQMGSNPARKGKGQYPGTSTAVKLRGRLNSGGGVLKNRLLNMSEISWDNAPPPAEYFTELFRVSRNQIIFGGNYFDLPPTRGIICWDKIQPWDNFSQWEMVWTSFDCPAKMYRISNRGGNNTLTKIHPTEKPVELYDRIYKDFAKEGMQILDTHLGSGSNRIAAYKAKCHFTGTEIQKSYFDDQEKRYYEFISKYIDVEEHNKVAKQLRFV